jgi:hypothetical protein
MMMGRSVRSVNGLCVRVRVVVEGGQNQDGGID